MGLSQSKLEVIEGESFVDGRPSAYDADYTATPCTVSPPSSIAPSESSRVDLQTPEANGSVSSSVSTTPDIPGSVTFQRLQQPLAPHTETQVPAYLWWRPPTPPLRSDKRPRPSPNLKVSTNGLPTPAVSYGEATTRPTGKMPFDPLVDRFSRLQNISTNTTSIPLLNHTDPHAAKSPPNRPIRPRCSCEALRPSSPVIRDLRYYERRYYEQIRNDQSKRNPSAIPPCFEQGAPEGRDRRPLFGKGWARSPPRVNRLLPSRSNSLLDTTRSGSRDLESILSSLHRSAARRYPNGTRPPIKPKKSSNAELSLAAARAASRASTFSDNDSSSRSASIIGAAKSDAINSRTQPNGVAAKDRIQSQTQAGFVSSEIPSKTTPQPTYQFSAPCLARRLLSSITCTICDESQAAEKFFAATSKCHHKSKVCTDCLQTWVGSQFESNGWKKIRCPECPQILQQEDVQRCASSHISERYCLLSTRQLLESLPNFHFCAYADCDSGQIHEGGQRLPIMVCTACNRRTCVVHKIPWHVGETCAQYRQRTDVSYQRKLEEASQKMIQKTSKKCPGKGCGYNVEKNGGCDHMTCTMCRHEFCWICMADYRMVRMDNKYHAPSCKYHSANL